MLQPPDFEAVAGKNGAAARVCGSGGAAETPGSPLSHQKH